MLRRREKVAIRMMIAISPVELPVARAEQFVGERRKRDDLLRAFDGQIMAFAMMGSNVAETHTTT